MRFRYHLDEQRMPRVERANHGAHFSVHTQTFNAHTPIMIGAINILVSP